MKKKIHLLSFYVAWGNADERPDIDAINEVIENGFIPIITWEPWKIQQFTKNRKPEDQPQFSLSSILSGKYDTYIWNWAIDLKSLKCSIFFRPMHEMNGNWYPWCGKVNGNTPADYIDAWRYIRSIFRMAQNENLIWVWSPYIHSVPEDQENDFVEYFPGNNEFDWFGLDGYNWGTSQQWSKWQSFKELFKNGYDQMTQLAPEKSLMVVETGCSEEGGNKELWIEETFKDLSESFPKIKALVWFNVNKECDWRIESSEKSINSFKKIRHFIT